MGAYSENGKSVAIVTGGGQGIGKAIVRRLLMNDYRVVIAEIDVEAGRQTLEGFQPLGEVRFIETDVSREEQVAGMVGETVAQFGRLDVLVNNAAVTRNKPLEHLTLEDWNAVLGANLTGTFLCSKHAAPHLRSRRGTIVNIASTRALMSEPDTEAYSASKGGVVALTHALALSLGPAIRVNCVSPGWIEVADWKKPSLREEPHLTEQDHLQHPIGRVGRPDDVSAMVCFLISPNAEFITGQNFVVDGGMTRKMVYTQ